VKRRFRMRDGEKFFAEGRDNATFDLKQKQMKKAGNWRTALRRSVLRQLAELGRDPRLFQPHARYRYAGKAGRLRLNDESEAGGRESFGAFGGDLAEEFGKDEAPEGKPPALSFDGADVELGQPAIEEADGRPSDSRFVKDLDALGGELE